MVAYDGTLARVPSDKVNLNLQKIKKDILKKKLQRVKLCKIFYLTLKKVVTSSYVK